MLVSMALRNRSRGSKKKVGVAHCALEPWLFLTGIRTKSRSLKIVAKLLVIAILFFPY